MMQQILFSASAHELKLLGGVRKQRWLKVEQLGYTLGQHTQFKLSVCRLMRTDYTEVPETQQWDSNLFTHITHSYGRLCQQTEKVSNCKNSGDVGRGEESSGQGMTEQSKNRKRQDKVIKDRTVEGEAGEERT